MPRRKTSEGKDAAKPHHIIRPRKSLSQEQINTRNKLVEEYADFAELVVVRIARSMRLPLTSKDEFLSAAFLGLLEAASRYDPSRCREFKAFAYIRMRGAIIDYIRSSCELTGYAYNKFKALEAAQEIRELELENGASIERRSESRLGDATSYLERIAVAFKLSTEKKEEEDEAEAEDTQNPEIVLQRKQKIRKIRSILATLPEKERTIIEQYYFQDRKLTEIAEHSSGLSKSWVSRLHERALEMLRERMSDSIEEIAA